LSPRQFKQHGLPVPERYYQLPNSVTFDYLSLESDLYEFSARIVRLKLEDGSTQMLVTNLDPGQFPLAVLQALYAKRWGIETSFRVLKYTVGLIHLHSRKSDPVLQEFFAAFTVFNFTQAAAWNVDEQRGRSKYKRRSNFSHAVYLCCEALRDKARDIVRLLERTLQPRRPGPFLSASENLRKLRFSNVRFGALIVHFGLFRRSFLRLLVMRIFSWTSVPAKISRLDHRCRKHLLALSHGNSWLT